MPDESQGSQILKVINQSRPGKVKYMYSYKQDLIIWFRVAGGFQFQ